MSLFVRTITGSMLDITRCPFLMIDDGGDGNFELLAFFEAPVNERGNWIDTDGSFVLFRDRSRRKVEDLLNQLAARANGEGSPIDPTSAVARRGSRFGAPTKKQPSPGTKR